MKITPPQVTVKVTKETATFELSGAIVKRLLIEAGYPLANKDVKNVELYVRVPGGGDWSNTSLHLEDHPLIIKVTTETTQEI